MKLYEASIVHNGVRISRKTRVLVEAGSFGEAQDMMRDRFGAVGYLNVLRGRTLGPYHVYLPPDLEWRLDTDYPDYGYDPRPWLR